VEDCQRDMSYRLIFLVSRGAYTSHSQYVALMKRKKMGKEFTFEILNGGVYSDFLISLPNSVAENFVWCLQGNCCFSFSLVPLAQNYLLSHFVF